MEQDRKEQARQRLRDGIEEKKYFKEHLTDRYDRSIGNRLRTDQGDDAALPLVAQGANLQYQRHQQSIYDLENRIAQLEKVLGGSDGQEMQGDNVPESDYEEIAEEYDLPDYEDSSEEESLEESYINIPKGKREK